MAIGKTQQTYDCTCAHIPNRIGQRQVPDCCLRSLRALQDKIERLWDSSWTSQHHHSIELRSQAKRYALRILALLLPLTTNKDTPPRRK